jgi:hypothetical protein
MLEPQDKKANFIAFSSYGEFPFEESTVKPHAAPLKKRKRKIMSTEKSLDPGVDAKLNSQTYL